MDRNTITGFILIILVFIGWLYFTMPSQKELQQQKAQQARKDSIAAAQTDSQKITGADTSKPLSTDTANTKSSKITSENARRATSGMGMFGKASQPDTTYFEVETPLYHSKFTNLGAGPATFTLNKYKTWDKQPLQLIRDTTRSAYTAGFLTSDNQNIETNQLLFKRLTSQQSLQLQKGDTAQVKYALQVAPGKRMIYTYTFRGDSYAIDLDITYQGLKQDIIGSNIDFGWEPGLNLTEKNRSQETRSIAAYAYTGGELEELQLSDDKQKEKNYNGSVDWVSTRTKFFTQIIKSQSPTESGRLVGQMQKGSDQSVSAHHYQSYISSRINNGKTSFKLYLGPLAYHPLDHFESTTFGMVNVGYSWMRWFSGPLVKYVIIPYFDLMGTYMNLGLAIILFGILVKMVLYPFTKKSYKSMAAMRELQPEMNEIKEKYEDDPQKQQKATMKLYKEAGANPLGGCLPMLLQLPILITLYEFIEHSILLRQSSFLWASDLSRPDYILQLPFHLPFLGDHIAGFVLLMAATMAVQTQLTGGMGGAGGGGAGAGGMGQVFKYFMPLMMLFIFNNFAAGLSLYYLVYNVVTILQQLMINKQIEHDKVVTKAQTAPA